MSDAGDGRSVSWPDVLLGRAFSNAGIFHGLGRRKRSVAQVLFKLHSDVTQWATKMIDTIRILTAITRAPITPEKVFEALGEKPPGFYDRLEALERFELIRINRLDGSRPTLTVELTDLGAERVIEALLGANQEIPEGLIVVRRKPGRQPGVPQVRRIRSIAETINPDYGKKYAHLDNDDWLRRLNRIRKAREASG